MIPVSCLRGALSRGCSTARSIATRPFQIKPPPPGSSRSSARITRQRNAAGGMLPCLTRRHMFSVQGRRYCSSSPDQKTPLTLKDGMPRFPNQSAGGMLRALDYGGTVVFAFSGTLQAAASGMDLLGCSVVGTITAVGGGTVRDLLLGNRPVFWMVETEYLLLCLLTSACTFACWPKVCDEATDSKNFKTAEVCSDSMGLAAFCVIGAQNGIRLGVPPIISVVCGMMTATFGGLIRDVLCNRPVRILHSHAEIYASCAAGGASCYVLAAQASIPVPVRIVIGVSGALAARVVAFTYDIKLPTMLENEK